MYALMSLETITIMIILPTEQVLETYDKSWGDHWIANGVT